MIEKPNGFWTRAPAFLVLTLSLFVIYNSNFRWYLTRDSIPTRVLPFSLLLDGHLYVDDWIDPYQQGQFARGAYYVAESRGHWYSVYPIIEPLAITPLYVAPAWWLSQQHPPLAKGSFVLTFVIDTMEKLSAALIAALSAGVLFVALRKLVSPYASLAITLVYALASNTWSTSSQTLWRHGFTEFSFALLLWALLRDASAPRYAFWAGLALALAAANKPAYAIFVLLFLIYFARTHRQSLFLFCLPLCVIGIPVVFYNLHFFGRLLGAYPNPLIHAGESSPLSPTRFPWWDGFAGLLVSPNRGLFIYTPWTILSLWGAARVWKQNLFGWGRYLILGMIGVYIIHARFGLWWGGGSFGPRYLTDLLPLLAFFLVPIWPRLRFSSLATAAFVITSAVALWIQMIGAYAYPNGHWDATPVPIEADPGRLWDWSDNQIMRTWRAGPDRPEIWHELPLFFQALASESDKPAVRLAIIGLDRDAAWGLLRDIAREPQASLVAIAEPHPEMVAADPVAAELLAKTRSQAPAGVKFYDDYVQMLDDSKPDAVMATTATNRHLEILRECAKRHIHFFTEEPMAANAAEAREMESLARAAKIKLMVNYWNAWIGPSQELFGHIKGGVIGPVQKMTVRCGREGREEIGAQTYLVRRPLDPAKNGPADDGPAQNDAGALMDFGSFGAEWALWLKGRPSSVFAYSPQFKTGQASVGKDDAVMVLQYPDATATVEASWRSPFTAAQVEVFGPKGSLLATPEVLYFRAPHAVASPANLHGLSVEIPIVPHETSSAVAYFVYHIRHDQAIEDPVSASMNVQVNEILDAAQESVQTGRAVALPKE